MAGSARRACHVTRWRARSPRRAVRWSAAMSDGHDSGADAPVEVAPAVARSPAGRAARMTSAAPLTEYELERLEKIKRNSAALAALNLPKLELPNKPPPAPKQRRPVRARPRRTARALSVTAWRRSPRRAVSRAAVAARSRRFRFSCAGSDARPAPPRSQRAEATEAPRRSSRVAAAPRESMADPGDSDSFGRGRGFSDTDDSGADDSSNDGSDEDRPRRKRQKHVRVHLVRGYPEAKPGAGIVAEAMEGALAAAAPVAGAIAAPAPPLPPPTDAGRRTTTGTVRQADGLQARFGHVMQAGAPTLHAHELAELRQLCTQPPYYSPVKLADLLVRHATCCEACLLLTDPTDALPCPRFACIRTGCGRMRVVRRSRRGTPTASSWPPSSR